MEFRNVKMGEICEIVTDYVANGSFKSLAENVKYCNEGYARLIRLVDYNNKFQKKDSIWVSKESYEFLKKSKLKGGEIIITNVGANLGTVFLAPILEYPQTLGPNSIMIKTREYDKFIYYLLLSNYGQSKIKEIISGSAMPKFNKTDFKQIEIKIPTIGEQTKIVKILENIDKKIELNNQIKDNLQEVIKNEYKEKIVNNSNVSLKKMNELVEKTIGGDWGKEELSGNYNCEVLCIRGADIPEMDNGSRGKAPNRFILEKNLINKQLHGNEIIIEISGGSPTQSTGRCAYITTELKKIFDKPLICTNFCRAIKLKENKYLPIFYMNLKNLYSKNIMFLYENGTTGIKNLDLTSLMENEEVSIVSDEDINKFNELFYAINKKIIKNADENKTLELLRDTLLPKLMNGEIDLDKIEI